MTETKNTKNNEVVAADIDFLPDENPADFKDDIKPVYPKTRFGLFPLKSMSLIGCWHIG